MFTVEWLTDGVRVHGQAMFGNTVEDVIRQAKGEARRLGRGGEWPDTIRITGADSKAPLISKLERFAA